MTSSTRAGVLFDVDGTLLDTNYLHVLAWWRACRDGGYDDVTMARLHRAIGMASELLSEQVLGRQDEGVIDGHGRHFEELRPRRSRCPAPRTWSGPAGNAGLATVLATSGKADDLDWMLPAIGAGDASPGPRTSEDVERVQAGARPPRRSPLDQHGLDPDRTTVVGDTVWDVEAAARAGMPCIGLTSGGISAQELREAGAVEVYDDPADLLAHLDESSLARRA